MMDRPVKWIRAQHFLAVLVLSLYALDTTVVHIKPPQYICRIVSLTHYDRIDVTRRLLASGGKHEYPPPCTFDSLLKSLPLPRLLRPPSDACSTHSLTSTA